MKCQNLFSGKLKKKFIILSSAELAERVVKFTGNGYPFRKTALPVLLSF